MAKSRVVRSLKSATLGIPTRRFVKPGRSPTLWEISLDGTTCRTRDGAAGAPKETTHPSPEQALQDYVTQVSSKLWGGHVEQVAARSPSPALPVLGPADVATQRAHLRSLLDRAQLSHRADAVDACLKPAIALRLRRIDQSDLPIGASRFGGCPDLPPKTVWPSRTDKATRDRPKRERPLDFVGQLRLEDIAPHDEAGLLPRAGLLSFFVLADYDSDDANEPDYLSVCRVLHHPVGVPLERTAAPSGAGRIRNGERIAEPYLAHAIEFFPIVTLPPSESRRFKKLRLTDAESDRFFEEVREPFNVWRSRRFPGIRGTHLLGYRDRDNDREPKQILLMQCESDYSTQLVWGTADFLYYWIAPAALAKARFDSVTSNYAD